MNLQISLLEPDAAARGETGRFRPLVQSQDADVKRSRRFLSARRHCQLHVFDCVDFHYSHIFLGQLEADCLDIHLSWALYFASKGVQNSKRALIIVSAMFYPLCFCWIGEHCMWQELGRLAPTAYIAEYPCAEELRRRALS
jgi:hypothetical protein